MSKKQIKASDAKFAPPVSPQASTLVVSDGAWDHCQHQGTASLFTLQPSPASDTSPCLTFGGATGTALDLHDADYVLDCGKVVYKDTLESKFIETGAPEFLALNKLIDARKAKVLRFDWPDMKAPTGVPVAFWRGLVAQFFSALPQGGHVIATCVGGHGRTGTCLAALLLTHSDHTAASVTDYIREAHCEKAIESEAQVAYLERLAAERDALIGRPHVPTAPQPSKVAVTTKFTKTLCNQHNSTAWCSFVRGHEGACAFTDRMAT